MRVLIDTSVWADFLNGYPSEEAQDLARIIEGEFDLCTCGIVVAEVFQGLRKDREREKVEKHFRDLTVLRLEGIEPYLRAAEIYRTLRRRGITVRSTVDCILAVLAEQEGCYVLAKDKDLRAILASGLVAAKPFRERSGRTPLR